MTVATSAPPTTSLVDHVWQRFQDVGFTPEFGPQNSKLLIRLYRELAAAGRPITRDEVDAIADDLGIEHADAREFVEGVSELGNDGEVRGTVGLTLNDYPHIFRVGGNELRNWCALDPLLITPALTEPVEIESPDPANGQLINISADASGVDDYSPDSTVVSIVVPEPGATDSLSAVWTMFCHHVHFFADRDSGEGYFKDRGMEVYLLTVDEAFELGRKTFGPLYEQL